MEIANETVTVDEAFSTVRRYAEDHPQTLRIFDGLGANGYEDPEPDQVTLADIGRLVVINGRPDADDVARLLDADTSQLGNIEQGATLEDCEIGDVTWKLASELYKAFDLDNIGPAKRSKLLHSKRPGLFFINDSVTGAHYEAAAKKHADPDGPAGQGFWAAARDDIRQAEFDQLMALLAETVVDSPGGPLPLGELSRVRVLDIVCWSPKV
jgi:hypothetical protein